MDRVARIVHAFLSLWVAASTLAVSTTTMAAPATLPRPRLTVLAWHDIVDQLPGGQARSDTTTNDVRTLIAEFEMIRALGFTPISLQRWLDATEGRASLPDRPVLLTFDDGYLSLYRVVFPLLKLYGYPAVAAIVTQWSRGEPDPSRPMHPCDWQQLREMADSGLMEIASHTDAMHHGIIGNPQQNLQPAAVTHEYLGEGRYEDESHYRLRLANDLERSADAIAQALGRRPRAIVWPYGAHNADTRRAARAAGFTVAMDLDNGINTLERRPGPAPAAPDDLPTLHRTLVESTMSPTDFAHLLLDAPAGRVAALGTLRSAGISLDDVYDADPSRQEARLSAMLERIRHLGVNTVVLDAFADPGKEGVARSLYFPNGVLPMRADLFNRAAWQLRTRAGVKVFARLPLRAFAWPAAPAPLTDLGDRDDDRIAAIYQALSGQGQFAGILFGDEGSHGDPAGDPLIARLQTVLRAGQPTLLTMVSVRAPQAPHAADPDGKRWSAGLRRQLAHFDLVRIDDVLASTDDIETGHSSAPDPTGLRDTVDQVKRVPGAFDRTLFEASGSTAAGLSAGLHGWLASGARHIGYQRDAVFADPSVTRDVRALVSTATLDEPRR